MPHEICTAPWEYAVEPFRIAGNLYYVGNRDVSCHLIDSGCGLILLDTAFPQTLYLLLESIRRLGFDPDDIVYVLHSHAHYDHCGGTRALVELTGAKTVLGEGDVDIIERRPELTWAPEYGVEFHEAFAVDVAVADGDVVSLGETRVTCMNTPGHTPGTISYFFEVRESGRTYRVGMHGGPGRNTLTDAYLAQYGLPLSRRADYVDSLSRLKREKVDIFIGAHPGQSRTLERLSARQAAANPFVDPSAWTDFIAGLQSAALEVWDHT